MFFKLLHNSYWVSCEMSLHILHDIGSVHIYLAAESLEYRSIDFWSGCLKQVYTTARAGWNWPGAPCHSAPDCWGVDLGCEI